MYLYALECMARYTTLPQIALMMLAPIFALLFPEFRAAQGLPSVLWVWICQVRNRWNVSVSPRCHSVSSNVVGRERSSKGQKGANKAQPHVSIGLASHAIKAAAMATPAHVLTAGGYSGR